jgi:hypothetical protein
MSTVMKLGVQKNVGNFRVAEKILASREGFHSTELVS